MPGLLEALADVSSQASDITTLSLGAQRVGFAFDDQAVVLEEEDAVGLILSAFAPAGDAGRSRLQLIDDSS